MADSYPVNICKSSKHLSTYRKMIKRWEFNYKRLQTIVHKIKYVTQTHRINFSEILLLSWCVQCKIHSTIAEKLAIVQLQTKWSYLCVKNIIATSLEKRKELAKEHTQEDGESFSKIMHYYTILNRNKYQNVIDLIL